MTWRQRRLRRKYRWLGLGPFPMFLEHPLSVAHQILNCPPGWSLAELNLLDALKRGQAS